MYKLLLALTLFVTSVQASQVKTHALRYPDMDEQFFDSLPRYKAGYYTLQLKKIDRFLHPKIGCNTPAPQYSQEVKNAIEQYRRANESLLQKNNNMAVKLLKEAAVHIDLAKVLLAYCCRYGIGTKCNKDASNLLLDLVAKDYEDKIDMILHLEFLLMRIQLGL